MTHGRAGSNALLALTTLLLAVHCGGSVRSSGGQGGAAGQAVGGESTGSASSQAGSDAVGGAPSLGGAPAQGGAESFAGSPVAAGASSAGASAIGCGRELGYSPGLFFSPSFKVGRGAQTYAGPARVSFSEGDHFSFVFSLSADDAQLAVEQQLNIYKLAPMPSFPIGATVWLEADPAGSPRLPYQSWPGQEWSLTLRDGPGGHILLAASSMLDAPSSTVSKPAFPIAAAAKTPLCTAEVSHYACGNATLKPTYFSLGLTSEPPISVADGERAALLLAGDELDVGVQAVRVDPGHPNFCTGTDLQPFYLTRFAIQLRAKNLEALIRALPL